MQKHSFQALLILKLIQNGTGNAIKNREHGINFFPTLSCLPFSLSNSKPGDTEHATSKSVALLSVTLQFPAFLTSINAQ